MGNVLLCWHVVKKTGNIAMVAAGDGGSLTNISGQEPIEAVVVDVKGLFLDMSLKGAKFSKLKDKDPDK
jgi:hypothetical protein